MLQQIMTAPGEIIFKEVETPSPQKGQVLVRIQKIGVCGSDIHVYHGKHPFTKYPITQGHEVSGDIVALGEGVQDLAIGQRVTIEPQLVCGVCHPCKNEKYNLCEELKVMGFQATGAASEYFATNQSKVTPLPADMSFDDGAMIEPLAVAVHAIKQAGDMAGKKIAVLGAGPIGNLVAQTAKALGAAEVMITDISDYRLQKAKETGIDICINTKRENFADALPKHFGPDKADVIYDCAGNNTTMGQAIQCARKGSVIVLVAVFDGPAQIDLAVLNDHELRLETSMMYRHQDYLQAIDLVSSGRIQLKPLITARFDFQDYKKAYEHIDANRETTMKVLIELKK